jgi:hypothetical protein
MARAKKNRITAPAYVIGKAGPALPWPRAVWKMLRRNGRP